MANGELVWSRGGGSDPLPLRRAQARLEAAARAEALRCVRSAAWLSASSSAAAAFSFSTQLGGRNRFDAARISVEQGWI